MKASSVPTRERTMHDGVQRVNSKAPQKIRQWLLQGLTVPQGPHGESEETHAWWKAMCLTGVDYFSTLGYQPGIAFLAAGALSPIATLILVLVTLFAAYPVYSRVAEQSPNGQGSISMLERLFPNWTGKVFVLCLLGFAATDFIITITLSAADGTAHLIRNPFVPQWLHHQEGLTLLLLALLGAIFLKGFKEAIGIAVFLVAIYLTLNLVVVSVAVVEVLKHPQVITGWKQQLWHQHGSLWLMLAVSLLIFPKLALGLSGFETGVAVMPLVKGDRSDAPERPIGRIRNTHKLLTSSAVIMSVFLIASSFVTVTLIPAAEFEPGGKANGRALAYLAHGFLGDGFGTLYDLSTIAILWFAGASAMAGLLNIVPRYLPRYGMAPSWTLASRPLVLVFTAIAFAVTILFRADVDAQGGAYATGVLVLMTSAAVAVTLAARRRGGRRSVLAFGLIALVFVYTTIVNVLERPDGVKIAAFFIGAIVAVSLVSRLWRVTELRASGVELDDLAQRYVAEAGHLPLRVIAHDPDRRDGIDYDRMERRARALSRIGVDEVVLFLEVNVRDPSEFAQIVTVVGEDRYGHRLLRADGSSVPNTIAAVLLHLRDLTGDIPHAYFSWSEKDPLSEIV